MEPDASIDSQLRAAIAGKHLIRVRYLGGLRVAEPHDYGIQHGVPRVLVFQRFGPASAKRKSGSGWRLLDVAKIEACDVLDDTFAGTRGAAHHNHYEWDVLYARVS